MIEVLISRDDEPLAAIRIERDHLSTMLDGSADYIVKFGVERGTAVGMHQRHIYSFPRKRLNALALVRQALATLDEKELELERDFDPDEAEAPVPSDLARRLRGTMREIQAWFR